MKEKLIKFAWFCVKVYAAYTICSYILAKIGGQTGMILTQIQGGVLPGEKV